MQLLPEKYSYFRRVNRANAQLEAGEESTPIDCVICMAAIDVSQRCNECMVSNLSVGKSNCIILLSGKKMNCTQINDHQSTDLCQQG